MRPEEAKKAAHSSGTSSAKRLRSRTARTTQFVVIVVGLFLVTWWVRAQFSDRYASAETVPPPAQQPAEVEPPSVETFAVTASPHDGPYESIPVSLCYTYRWDGPDGQYEAGELNANGEFVPFQERDGEGDHVVFRATGESLVRITYVKIPNPGACRLF